AERSLAVPLRWPRRGARSGRRASRLDAPALHGFEVPLDGAEQVRLPRRNRLVAGGADVLDGARAVARAGGRGTQRVEGRGGLVVFRRERLLEVPDRFGRVPLLDENAAQVEVRSAVVRLVLDRGAVLERSFLELPLGHQEIRVVVVSLRVVRVDIERPAER